MVVKNKAFTFAPAFETKTASEMWDIMEELGIAVDKYFFEPCDLTPPTLEELCRMFGVK